MNLDDLSEYLRALAEHEDIEVTPVTYAENFLIRSFTYCVLNACFPLVYLLAISDVSHAIAKFALNELDSEEVFKATLLAEKSIQDFKVSEQIDTDFSDEEEVPF